MSIIATVHDGVIRLPGEPALPEGATVRVEVLSPPPVPAPVRSLAERFSKFIGAVDSGIGDLAMNHDHYRLGVPRRQP